MIDTKPAPDRTPEHVIFDAFRTSTIQRAPLLIALNIARMLLGATGVGLLLGGYIDNSVGVIAAGWTLVGLAMVVLLTHLAVKASLRRHA